LPPSFPPHSQARQSLALDLALPAITPQSAALPNVMIYLKSVYSFK
ncbi:hypothetical protein CCACVL1_07655, partial [Corchorus capsularis]